MVLWPIKRFHLSILLYTFVDFLSIARKRSNWIETHIFRNISFRPTEKRSYSLFPGKITRVSPTQCSFNLKVFWKFWEGYRMYDESRRKMTINYQLTWPPKQLSKRIADNTWNHKMDLINQFIILLMLGTHDVHESNNDVFLWYVN